MNPDDLVPPLRDGVRLIPPAAADQGGAIEDAAFGRRMRLDPRGLAVLGALDAPQTLGALAARVGGELEGLARALRSFARLHLLDTPTSRALARDAERLAAVAEAARSQPDDVPIIVRDDARFSCTMCGSCCGGHNIGPVFDDVLEGLADKAADLEAATRSAKGLFVTLDQGPGAPPTVFCQSSRGSCVFLDDDSRCRIHAAYGGDAKPRACRIFPYELIATPDGVVVTIQRECRGFPEARLGKRLADDLPELRRLLRLVPPLARVRKVVELVGGHTLRWPAYLALEDAMHAVVDAHEGDEVATLLDLRAVLFGAAGIDPGEAVEGEDPDTLRAELDTLTDALTDLIAQLRRALPPAGPSVVVRSESLGLVERALGGLRGDLPRLLHPLRRPEARAIFREHLHHALMAKGLATASSVRAGLGRLIFDWLLALSLAVARAREVKRRHLVAQDVMDGLVVTSFFMRHEDVAGAALERVDPLVSSLFVDRLPGIVRHAALLPEPDTRAELVKF